MFTLGQEHILEEASKPQPVMFTAGAVPIINKKGQVSMEKVHVKRYIAGKRPDWASDDESSSEDEFRKPGAADSEDETADLDINTLKNADDRRLRRLQQHVDEQSLDVEEKIRRHRVHEPEVIHAESEAEASEDEIERPTRFAVAEDEDSGEEELNDEEIEARRERQRQRARAKVNAEEELLAFPQEEAEEEIKQEVAEDEEYTTDDSEYTDSDEDDDFQRLKPVFVRKKDRLTIQEREKEEERRKELAEEAKLASEERRRLTIKMIEKEAREEEEARSAVDTESAIAKALNALDSDDGNDEAEYEGWKLRELKRVKRDREEREALQKERDEVERLSKMTEEERVASLRSNPKVIVNEKKKGKYKFLQKYYHRGAFFMEKQEDVYSRDFAEPTLDDHFDKTVLPKVMQVKNFGRSGRTKYTHLVDQDTTRPDVSPWSMDTSSANKLLASRGGMKQLFERPSNSKKANK